MNDSNTQERILAKTPQQRFLHILEQDFHFAPKIAEAIFLEAESCLLGKPTQLRPGQVRVILVRRGARHGQALSDSPRLEVTAWK
jgi:hypothetical protein